MSIVGGIIITIAIVVLGIAFIAYVRVLHRVARLEIRVKHLINYTLAAGDDS